MRNRLATRNNNKTNTKNTQKELKMDKEFMKDYKVAKDITKDLDKFTFYCDNEEQRVYNDSFYTNWYDKERDTKLIYTDWAINKVYKKDLPTKADIISSGYGKEKDLTDDDSFIDLHTIMSL